MGKPEARAQAVGMLQAGSTQAEVAEAMKISLSTLKRWWKKWVSQKSLVDEKKSGRPSVLRKVQKLLFLNQFTKGGGAPEN